MELLFHEGIMVPAETNHFDPYKQMTWGEFLQSILQILHHYHQINPRSALVRSVDAQQIQVIDDEGVHSFSLDSQVFGYQKIGETLTQKSSLVCSPGDDAQYIADGGRMRRRSRSHPSHAPRR